MDIFTILQDVFTQHGYTAVFLVLLACGFGIPIPEDVALVTGGIIAGLGNANVHTMCFVGIAGVLLGDGLMFTAGKVFGTAILRFRPVAWVMTPKRYGQVQEKFERYGNWVLFVARFLPGLRTPIFITAGMSQKIPYWRFWLMDGMAALVSVPVWVYLGYWGASNIEHLQRILHRFQMGVFVVLALLAAGLLWVWWSKR
jgi:membrane protein DedA with SNARE-associated domain